MKKIGMKPSQHVRPMRSNDPIGRLHRDAIARVAAVPSAAKGYPNSTPGNSDPLVFKKDK